MADTFKDKVNDRIADEQTYAVPGTRRGNEIERAEAQQGWLEDLKDGFKSTAVAGAARVIKDEAPSLIEETFGENHIQKSFQAGGPLSGALAAADVAGAAALSLFGFRSGEKDYNKDERFDELTDGIPYEFQSEIMEHDNFAAAMRARNRIMQDLERGRRMTLQDEGQLVAMAGSLFDADLPLMMFSGGAYGAAKVSRTALQASKMARLSPRAAMRVSGSSQGLNAGLQAGAVVGAVDAGTRETVGWQDVANYALMGMAMGGTIGAGTKGDLRMSVRAAEEEFYGRIFRDDPSLETEVNVNNMPADPFMDRIDEGSIGAAQVQPNAAPVRTPTANATPTDQAIIDAATDWRDTSGWQIDKDAADAHWWGKAAASPLANMTTNNFTRLYKSRSSVANYIAGTIFESAGGLGRGKATAAVRMENYHKRIQQHLGKPLRDTMNEWAKDTGHTWQGSGYHISGDGQAVFNREVMLELNDRSLGRASTRHPEIKKAADQYEKAGVEALGIGRGRDGEIAVDGFEGLPDRRGYTPYKWSGSKINKLIDDGVVDEEDIVNAVADGYRKAGMAADPRVTQKIAKAVIHRARTEDAEIDMSVTTLLSGDGKTFLRDALVGSGVLEVEADQIMKRLIGKQHDRSRESFAKSRNDIDMDAPIRTKDGSDIRIVDLFDNDMHGIWQRYTRQMAGSAALARHGITNRAKREEFISAMQAEQRALGEEPLEANLLRAMFSHFNAGPVHGYGFGKNASINEGIGNAALAKRLVNLSLLEKLGVTQLAETGVMIAQNGLGNWLQRGPMAMLDKQLAARNKELLDDLSFFTGEIGQDHWAFAPWLDLDETTRSERGSWLAAVNKYTSVGSFVQGYTSAFNQVRAFQQKTAALGVSDKVFRTIKKAMDEGTAYDESTMKRFKDLGFDEGFLQDLEDLISNGTIEFTERGGQTFVNRLNMSAWDAQVGEVFAAGVTRNINQVVQRSMAGEQDAWMHTHVGSILMHLKTFPLQAIQKQVMRQARFMDKEAFSTVLMGLATAAVAVKVRDALDGRERDAMETAQAAFNYSNMTGWIPTLYDPLMTLLGMDDARMNPYGPNYDITPPTVRVGGDMLRIVGALANTATGTADYYDGQALKAIPFAGTYVLSRVFD